MALMRKPKATPAVDRIIATMIELARCTSLHRIVIAGPAAPQRIAGLHRRGYGRVATTANCGLPRGQYDAALVEWQLHSVNALETTLNWLVHFLAPASVLVIWIDAEERSNQRKLRSMLEKLGFRVEAGTRCESGLAISARRLDAKALAIAA
jgi:hypothetical protein